MFSGELDRKLLPFSSRAPGILLGSLLLVSVTASLVSARTVAVSLFITTAAFLITSLKLRRVDLSLLRQGLLRPSYYAFLVFALLSAIWARDSVIPLKSASIALLVAVSTVAMVSLINREKRPNVLHMAEGLWIGFFIGLAYLAVELFTDQGIKLALYRILELKPSDLQPQTFFEWRGLYLVGISKEDLTRNITPAVILLWPIILIITGTWQPQWRTGGSLGVIAVTAMIVHLSSHESSKLALVLGLSAFVGSHFSAKVMRRLTAAGWLVACLAVPPLVMTAYRLEMHQSSWLQATARYRIIIWNYTAEKSLQSPWIGVGANMTYVLGPELETQNSASATEKMRPTLNIHAHNIYLQTWFELGAIGAVLLTLAGLAAMKAMQSMSSGLHPYAYATFVSCASMAATSYGMWQTWYVALFGLCAVVFTVGGQLKVGPKKVNAISKVYGRAKPPLRQSSHHEVAKAPDRHAND